MSTIIKSPWESTFLNLLKQANRNVYLASPFLKKQTAELIDTNSNKGVDLRYLGSFKLASFYMGASDLEAIRVLSRMGFLQKSVHNLHAKFFVFDDKAVITSANLTPGGLRNNLEYGIVLEGEIARQVKRDFIDLFDNPEVPELKAEIIDKAEEILSNAPKDKRVTFTSGIMSKSLFYDHHSLDKFHGGFNAVAESLSPWKRDVFIFLDKIEEDIFSLEEVYIYENELSELHPENRNVKAKIRQQLQYLRDLGLLEFVNPGLYRKLWEKDIRD